MKTHCNRLAACFPVVLLVALTPGCATQALWQHTAAHKWMPSLPIQVLVNTDTNHQPDVVILFCQVDSRGATNASRTVGWKVSQPPDQLALTPKAIRQLTNSCGGIQSVLVYTSDDISDYAAQLPLGFAVWNRTNAQITVHIKGKAPEPFTLPSTSQKQNTALRVGVLPVAIVGDAVTVGLAAAFALTFLVCGGH